MNQAKPRPRRAFVMISALALLILVASLATSWTSGVLRQRGQARLASQHAQAEWLGESALRRGLARLRREPDHPGEAWLLSPDELQQAYGAAITTRVERPEEGPPRLIAVVRIPNESDPRVTHTASLRLPTDTAGESP
ncbi:hypothetical protein MalM25_22930 [Planctomycetes bacterium MalM25]|nr:hypothetical protein MalM25_22930 [Planctomycetes bacterium MalM25]